MDRKQQARLYRVLFFVFCAAGFVFVNAFILYFEDPGRFSPVLDFITVMIVFAGMETVLSAGVFYCLLMVIRLQREEEEEKEAGAGDLSVLPPGNPRVSQDEDRPVLLLPVTKQSSQGFEKLLRVLILLVVVVGVIFVLFLLAVSFIAGSPAHDIRPMVTTVTVRQPDETTITVTYQGKQGEDKLSAMTARVADSTGQVRTETIGSETGVVPLIPGDTITLHGTFSGKDSVTVFGHFTNGIDQVVWDTTV